jgi:hypothetical protein
MSMHNGPRLRCIVALTAGSMLLGACVSLPENEVLESLDERTGDTVSRLSRPIELLATTPQGAADPFAYAAPFEVNRMGRRELYLWLSVPAPATGVQVLLDGEVVDLELVPAEGAPRPPYASPAPWHRSLIFALGESAGARLAAASDFGVLASPAQGSIAIRYSGTWDGPGIIASFLRSLGLSPQ